MKKFLSVLFSYLFLTSQVFALYPNAFHNMQWEIRPWATAGSVNGCGFATSDNQGNEFGGTDYTQQDNAQLTITDLVSSSATACILTSVTGGFTSGMVGNTLRMLSCTSGCTIDWYLISQVIDNNTISVASSPCGGAPLVDGTAKIGGACSMNAGAGVDDALFENVFSSNIVWISSGLIIEGQTIAVASNKCTIATPCYFNGYSQTRGDAVDVFDTSTAALPTINTGGTAGITFGTYTSLKNLRFTGSGSSVLIPGTGNLVRNVHSRNTSATIGRNALTIGTDNTIINTDLVSQAGNGISLAGSNSTMMGLYIHDSADGSTGGQSRNRILNSVFNANRNGPGNTSNNNPMWLVNVTINGFQNVKVGTASLVSSSSTMMMTNSIISNYFTPFGATAAGATDFNVKGQWMTNNALYNIASTGNVRSFDDSTLYLTESPYTDVSEIYGATAAISGTQLFMHGGGFFQDAGITDGVDYLTCHWGSGATRMSYLIQAHSSHSVTLNGTIGTNTTQDKTFTISKGKNFTVSTALKGAGVPNRIGASSTTVAIDIGGAQRVEPASGGGSGGFIIQ